VSVETSTSHTHLTRLVLFLINVWSVVDTTPISGMEGSPSSAASANQGSVAVRACALRNGTVYVVGVG
jgi:hypothetical protein